MALADGMDFRFLLDPERELLSIGCRLEEGTRAERLDNAHYDLLASEARLSSFFAIAKGDVPKSHWFHLGRPVTAVGGAYNRVRARFEHLVLTDAACAGASPPGARKRVSATLQSRENR